MPANNTTMNQVCATVLDAIGETPLVSLKAFGQSTTPKLYGKLECTNPSGSMKDRAARGMIEWAEREHNLSPGVGLWASSLTD